VLTETAAGGSGVGPGQCSARELGQAAWANAER